MRAPCPNRMPLGLIRKTRPFEVSVPRMTEGSGPMTRLRTLDAALCWMKLVVSLAPIENPRQLMMAPGLLVMLSELPTVEKLA